MVGLQGNTLHCSKSESLSSLGFFVNVAAAFAAAALGVLEAAEATIGEESETEEDNNDLTLALCASFFEACLPYEPTKYIVPQTRHV